MTDADFAMNLLRWFWIPVILISVVNVKLMLGSVRTHIARNPNLRRGYRQMAAAYLLWSYTPWLVLETAAWTGNLSSIEEIYDLRSMKTGVWAFWASLAFANAVFVWWSFSTRGTRYLNEHPGFFKYGGMGIFGSSAKAMRKAALLNVALYIGILTGIWIATSPHPSAGG